MPKRDLKVFVSFQANAEGRNPMKLALDQVMGLIDAVVVENQKEADIIVTDDVRLIVTDYDEKKQYVVLDRSGRQPSFDQPNVTVATIINMVPLLYKIASRINLEDEVEENPVTEIATSSPKEEKPGKPWVLVVDDTEKNRVAAILQLGGYNVIVASDFDEAREMMSKYKFDYALLDLNLPVSTKGALGNDALAKYLGQQIPYGLLLLMEACHHGASSAVVTYGNHHQDPFNDAFERISQNFLINGSVALLLQARMEDGVKDWAWALKQLQQA